MNADGYSFSAALSAMRSTACSHNGPVFFWCRRAWRTGRMVHVRPASADSMSYVEYVDVARNERAPWTPTRCDLLTDDWVRCHLRPGVVL